MLAMLAEQPAGRAARPARLAALAPLQQAAAPSEHPLAGVAGVREGCRACGVCSHDFVATRRKGGTCPAAMAAAGEGCAPRNTGAGIVANLPVSRAAVWPVVS